MIPDPDALLPDLTARVWQDGLTDREESQRVVLAALAAGASYRSILQALRLLWRMGLPGHEAAAQASARWSASIDMALMALDLGLPAQGPKALAHLAGCVAQANRRRAALAHAHLRCNQPDAAQAVLAQIDPASPTALEDVRYRADLALADGRFTDARADIAWLEGQGHNAQPLTLRLCYRAHGARALAEQVAQTPLTNASSLAQAFEIFLGEGDYTRAAGALAHWQAAPDAPAPQLARAQCRFALERGEPQAARAMLNARLDLTRPWDWTAIDHLQWLRAGLALENDLAGLGRHADAALRLLPRHAGLVHMAMMVLETVTDWSVLERAEHPQCADVDTASRLARRALRMGRAGRALIIAAQARRSVAPQDAHRLHLLRADAFTGAGRLRAAQRALVLARSASLDAPRQADTAVFAAELALATRAAQTAASALRMVEDAFPDRMPLWLAKARLAFFDGDFRTASQALLRFNALKAAQIGTTPNTDLRDLITQDALQAVAGHEAAFQLNVSVEQTTAMVGLAHITASPGLSACLIARAQGQGRVAFTPSPNARIPRQIAHYWQGPQGPALARAQKRWRDLHGQFEHRLFDEEAAQSWLARTYDRRMVTRFAALDSPAARADLFRLCWITRAGGVFADLDEYPRLPITPWLTEARAVLCIEQGFGTIANNFIAAIPCHPLCQMALDLACAALDQTDRPYPWWHTGPAQWTRAAFACMAGPCGDGLRLLSQADYGRRIATNLPYPHKRSAEHWR